MDRLHEFKNIKIFGQLPGKGPIISFNLKEAHAHDVATVLDQYGIAVRAGSHCAMPLLASYGVTSTCRASFAMYNTIGEIDLFVEALVKAQKLFS